MIWHFMNASSIILKVGFKVLKAIISHSKHEESGPLDTESNDEDGPSGWCNKFKCKGRKSLWFLFSHFYYISHHCDQGESCIIGEGYKRNLDIILENEV